MSWSALLDLIAAELGTAAAQRVEERARRELPGVRITVCRRPILTRDAVEDVAPGHPREAAKALGVHPSTAYRALRRPMVR
jgi:hypothetical protein